MNQEFIPYEQALELKKLGFDQHCLAFYGGDGDSKIYYNSIRNGSGDYEPYKASERLKWFGAPLYQQAFRWFREKFEFTYSIGKTNIAVVHYLGTTQLLQDNESYEAAELAAIKWFIDVAKQQIADTSQWISNEVDKMVVEQLIEIAKQQ